jgi:hypothetical protein
LFIVPNVSAAAPAVAAFVVVEEKGDAAFEAVVAHAFEAGLNAFANGVGETRLGAFATEELGTPNALLEVIFDDGDAGGDSAVAAAVLAGCW